jgi:hypothetical protein
MTIYESLWNWMLPTRHQMMKQKYQRLYSIWNLNHQPSSTRVYIFHAAIYNCVRPTTHPPSAQICYETLYIARVAISLKLDNLRIFNYNLPLNIQDNSSEYSWLILIVWRWEQHWSSIIKPLGLSHWLRNEPKKSSWVICFWSRPRFHGHVNMWLVSFSFRDCLRDCFLVPLMWSRNRSATGSDNEACEFYTKCDILCHMVCCWMTILINKWTNIVMDDEWVWPLAKTLPSLVNNLWWKILINY